jgi:KUP system potassium uptake protein
MSTWRQGRQLLREKLGEQLPVDLFLSSLETSHVTRVPGTAVFMDSRATGMPHTLLHNVKHNKVLHEQVVFLSFRIRQVPRVNPAERVEVIPIAPGFTRVIASWGFMETPSTPQVLEQVERQSTLRFKMMDTTFFLGHETVVYGPRAALRPWRRRVFGWLLRNAQSPAAHFELPPNRVVELGAQVTL